MILRFFRIDTSHHEEISPPLYHFTVNASVTITGRQQRQPHAYEISFSNGRPFASPICLVDIWRADYWWVLRERAATYRLFMLLLLYTSNAMFSNGLYKCCHKILLRAVSCLLFDNYHVIKIRLSFRDFLLTVSWHISPGIRYRYLIYYAHFIFRIKIMLMPQEHDALPVNFPI